MRPPRKLLQLVSLLLVSLAVGCATAGKWGLSILDGWGSDFHDESEAKDRWQTPVDYQRD